MKTLLEKIDKKWQAYALAGCISVLFLVCLMNIDKIWGVVVWIFSIFKPVIFGFIIAYIIDPMAVMFHDKIFRFIKKENIRWGVSVILTVIVVLLILILLTAAVVPQMVNNIVSLADNYEHYVYDLKVFLNQVGSTLGNEAMFDKFIERMDSENGLISKVGDVLTNNADEVISAITTTGNAAVSWLLGAIFAVYFLFAKKGILKAFSRLFVLSLSPLKYERARILLEKFNSIFSKYIVFELLDAAIIGVINFVCMVILKMPDAMFVSFIMAFTNLIPTFGPIIGAAIGGFLLLLVQPTAVIPFLIVTLVLQLLDAYIIKPKLFGSALNVPGVIILIAIVILGKMMGIVGMLIAIPVAGILVYLYSEVFIPWLELKRDLAEFKKMADGMESFGSNDIDWNASVWDDSDSKDSVSEDLKEQDIDREE